MMIKKQRGLTLISLLLIAAVVVIVAITAMKIIPAYIENYTVVSSAKALNNLPQEERRGPPSFVARTLFDKLDNQLHINGVDSIKKENIKIKYKNEVYIVDIDYEKRVPLSESITLLIHFKDTVNVNAGKA